MERGKSGDDQGDDHTAVRAGGCGTEQDEDAEDTILVQEVTSNSRWHYLELSAWSSFHN